MYKYLWVLIFAYQYTNACDFCGCAPSASSADVASLQPQSMIGIAYGYRSFDFQESDVELKKTKVMNYSLNAAYAPVKWMDIRLNLPLLWMKNYYAITDENSVSTESRAGLGDMQLFANFKAWSKPGMGEKKVGQQLNFGFGLELPTGRKRVSQNELLQDLNFGSQSVDYLFSGIYSLSIRKWGITQSGFVKINTRNKESVKFGNIYTYQLLGNYSAGIKKSMLVPTAGFKIEVASRNLNKNIIQQRSEYWVYSLAYGISWMKKNWKITGQVQHPLAQLTSKGEITQKTNFNINFSYQFLNKKTKQTQK